MIAPCSKTPGVLDEKIVFVRESNIPIASQDTIAPRTNSRAAAWRSYPWPGARRQPAQGHPSAGALARGAVLTELPTVVVRNRVRKVVLVPKSRHVAPDWAGEGDLAVIPGKSGNMVVVVAGKLVSGVPPTAEPLGDIFRKRAFPGRRFSETILIAVIE